MYRRLKYRLEWKVRNAKRFVEGIKFAWYHRGHDYMQDITLGNVRVNEDRNGNVTVHPVSDFELTLESPSVHVPILEEVAKAIGVRPYLEEHGGWYYLDVENIWKTS